LKLYTDITDDYTELGRNPAMSVIGRALTMVFLFFQQEYWSPAQQDPVSGGSPSGEFVGLVLARRGSKGIPHKNMAPLNGHPLIHWALEAMIQSQGKREAYAVLEQSTEFDLL
jgi:hypothetical protein